MRPVYDENPTPEEISAILGPRWAVCRPTPKNVERYGRCITRKQYREARQAALDARAQRKGKLD